ASVVGPAGGGVAVAPEGDPAGGAGAAAVTSGSASWTVSSCHSFHGWNQYSPKAPPTTAAISTPAVQGLNSALRTRPMSFAFPGISSTGSIQRADRPFGAAWRMTKPLRLRGVAA